jgi:aminoglycoside/choline kinase family phosphotransferase
LIDGEAFLEAAGWAGATCVAIPSDASDRRYFRVSLGGETAVLMQAPVATSVPARRQFEAFRRVSGWLRGIGLAAPAELSAEPSAGLLLLEDLGEVADLAGDRTGLGEGLLDFQARCEFPLSDPRRRFRCRRDAHGRR